MSNKAKQQASRHLFRKAGDVKSVGNDSEPYGISWSNDIPIQPDHGSLKRSAYRYLATVAGRYTSIFGVSVSVDLSMPEQGTRSEPFELVQSYHDPNKDELLYCCVFAGRCQEQPPFLLDEALTETCPLKSDLHAQTARPYHGYDCLPFAKRRRPTGGPSSSSDDEPSTRATHQLLCVAGKSAFVKVIDTQRQLLLYSLRCLDEIWDLQRSPANEWVIVGASKDATARIWNLQDGGSLLYILGGHGGHRDALITASWHSSGEWVATAGIDMALKIWHVGQCVEEEAGQQLSPTFVLAQSRDAETERQHGPAFSTDLLHNSAVDSILFVGNLIISKSWDERINLWLPCGLFDTTTAPKTVQTEYKHLRHFRIPFEQSIWYVKCAVDPSCRLLAAGNDKGEVYIWDIFDMASDSPRQILSTCSSRQQSSCIRDVKFSRDGTTLAATNDSGMVTKWDLVDLGGLWKPSEQLQQTIDVGEAP